MVIVFFDGFMIAIFLLIALGFAYQAYLALHGIVFVLTIIFFAAITIFTIAVLIDKARVSLRCAMSKPQISWNLFMSTVASAISLYTCHLFMRDLRIYGDGIGDMIFFVVGLIVGGGLCLYTISGWIEALATDYPSSFNYKGFFKELAAFLIAYGIYSGMIWNLL